MLKHGNSRVGEHKIWRAMIDRCYNEAHESYNQYGGRGIKVCEDWLNSYENFFRDMGKRPSIDYSIERNDVNGNYCPENCRWILKREQAWNKTTSHIIEFNGEAKCIGEWAQIYNMCPYVLRSRYIVYGWSFDKSISTPVLQRAKNILNEKTGDIYRSLRQAEKKTGIDRKIISLSLKGEIENKTGLAYYIYEG